MVAYHDRINLKWYRAKIDLVFNEHSYIVWLIDYGRPILVSKCLVERLDPRFSELPQNKFIKVGVANVVPADKMENWNVHVAKDIQRLLEEARTIEFTRLYRWMDHEFGRIVIKADGREINLLDLLSESPYSNTRNRHEFLKGIRLLKSIDIARYQQILDENPNFESNTAIRQEQEIGASNSDTNLENRDTTVAFSTKAPETPLSKQPTIDLPSGQTFLNSNAEMAESDDTLALSDDIDEATNLRPCLPFETNPTEKTEIQFYDQGLSDSDKSSSLLAKEEHQETAINPKVMQFLERMKKKQEQRANGILPETQKDESPQTLNLVPADYDQVVGQVQRAHKLKDVHKKPTHFHRRESFPRKKTNIPPKNFFTIFLFKKFKKKSFLAIVI